VNLTLRIGSAAVLLAIVTGVLWAGSGWLTALVTVGALVSAWEYSRLMGRAAVAPPAWLLFPLTAWLAMAFEIPAVPHDAFAPITAGVVVGLLLAVALRTSILQWAVAVGGALYLGYLLSYYVALYRWRLADTGHFGMKLAALVVLTVVVGDSVAYFIGSAFGRHRFFESLSPRKSIEGAVAGALGSVGFAAGVGLALVGLAPPAGAGLGLLVAVAAQGGDLVESALKRQAHVKDSSNLIPGHGGLLDRVDSLVLVGPVVYSYLKLIAFS